MSTAEVTHELSDQKLSDKKKKALSTAITRWVANPAADPDQAATVEA